MQREVVRDLVQQFVAGRLSRRAFVARATALGLSASAIGAILRGGAPLAAAQDDPLASWPPPPYIEEPDTEILMPIEGPLTEEKVSFRLLNSDQGLVTDFENNRMTEWLEGQTNVHIDWELVPSEEAESKLNLMLSSGDIPEIIFSVATTNQAQFYGSQGLFLRLNDLIAEHAPRLQKLFEVYPHARDGATSPDGSIYIMPNLEDCFQCSLAARLWIYQPWLDALGLEMPQTTDEFEQVLLAFKEQDPNGNGQADEIPLSGSFRSNIDNDAWNGPLDRYFMNSFLYNPGYDGIGGPWLTLRDGKVTPVYNTPEWREGLRYLHRLYEQGLIDPQSFTQQVDGLQRLGNNPETVILGVAPSGWWYDFVSMEPDNPRWTEYVAVPPLKGPGGVQYAAWEPAWSDASAVISSACKDPALAVRWIDTLYWQEASLRSHDGVLGEDWRWAEEGEVNVGGTQALWKLLTEFVGPTDRTWGGVGPAYWSSFMGNGGVVDPETASRSIDGLLFQAAKTYEPYKQPAEWVLPLLTFNADQATAIADPETTITQYVEQMITAFVRGDTDLDAGWDQYLSTLDQMGLAPYLQVHQDAYDVKYGG